MTLFPDNMNSFMHESIIGRACKKGILEINCVQIRDYTLNKQMQVDDYPYGGGWGCVMMAQPLKSCLDSIISSSGDRKRRVIYMSPQGKPFTQDTARRLANEYEQLILVCGHYEGIDERFIEECVDEEISLGDFVLTGGELAAMAITDSVCRLIPGVLSDEECYTGESHWDGTLEYPQYTRPEVWEGRKVPEVLLNGDHAKIVEWRRYMSLKRTKEKRPDLFEKLELTEKSDKVLIEKINKDSKRIKLTEPIEYRLAEKDDMEEIGHIISEARKLFRKYKVDQWQDNNSQEKMIEEDILNHNYYVVTHGSEIAGCFYLAEGPNEVFDNICDGKWHSEGKHCIGQRVAVSEKYRGTGIADKLLECIDKETTLKGASSVRIATHKKNKSMKNLLDRNGYRFRGNISIDVETGHDSNRQAFEKVFR